MAGNRLFFPVQAVKFYQGRWWDLLANANLTAIQNNTAWTNANPALGADAGTVLTPNSARTMQTIGGVTRVFDCTVAKGVQDVSVTSNFALTPTFELGQAAIYENVEGIPTVEITVSKVLDGRPLLWHLATLDAPNPTLIGRTSAYCTFQIGLWPDTEERAFWRGAGGQDGVGTQLPTSDDMDPTIRQASGWARNVAPFGVITCPKCYPSSLSYTINTTEGATENLTLSGNEKIWARARQSTVGVGAGNRQAWTISNDARFQSVTDFVHNDDTPAERIVQGYNVMLSPLIIAPGVAPGPTQVDANGALLDPDCSVFPTEIPGITPWGTNDVVRGLTQTEGIYKPDPNYARVQSVSFSVTLTRNDINALGYKLPVHKSVQMPIQVSTEITVVSTTDDGIEVSAFSSACQNTSSLKSGTIRVAVCTGEPPNPPTHPGGISEQAAGGNVNGYRFYTGMQNKLTSVSFGQGGTGGGNVQATYSYQTNNDFTVVGKSDPNRRQGGAAPAFNALGKVITAGGWWNNRVRWVTG